MTNPLIGTRIRALREEHNLSQDALANVFGFKDRQTISAIETGARRVTAEELVLAVERFDVPMEYFTDPFQLIGEGRFSWRRTEVDVERLTEFESQAGRWIAAYRELAPKVGHDVRLMRHSLGLTRNSRFEDAMRTGERFAAEFDLGKTPAMCLRDVMEQKLGILVLVVDAEPGISGAACRLPELDTVLIARGEVVGRRNFDLAHELFHLLTWDAMPPEHFEEARETGGNRVEQLANNFAAAVLMPTSALESFRDDWSGLTEEELISELNSVASDLQVSASALKWRLAALGKLKQATAKSVSDAALRNNGRDAVFNVVEDVPPALFSLPFMKVVGLAIDRGLVSVRKTATLLDMSVEALAELFAVHNVPCSFEL